MQCVSGSTVIRSSKCDLSATLEGSAPYIVVFWPNRTNFPRRAGLRQWVEGFAAIFSLCFLLSVDGFNMFTVFLGRLALLGQTNMKHDIWSRSITCFPLGWNHHAGCVLYKSSCRLMSGDKTVLVLRMILHVSSQLTLVTQVLHQVIW